MGMVKVQLVDMVNGEPLTTPDQPAELDNTIEAAELVQQILNFVGQLPEGHLVDPKATKIVKQVQANGTELAPDAGGRRHRGWGHPGAIL